MTKAEAIERLENDCCKSRVYCELYPDACQKEECEIYMAIEALKERPKGEWIPCSERLPLPDDNPVLVSWMGMTNIGWYSCGRWETGTRLPMDGVEAWKPLPKPYEVKE